MSAAEDLLQDHILIRRLQVIIEKCYTQLHKGKEIPRGDLIKIADIIEQFVDLFTMAKKKMATFQKLKVSAHIQKKSENSW